MERVLCNIRFVNNDLGSYWDFMVYRNVNNKMDFIPLITQVTLVPLYTC